MAHENKLSFPPARPFRTWNGTRTNCWNRLDQTRPDRIRARYLGTISLLSVLLSSVPVNIAPRTQKSRRFRHPQDPFQPVSAIQLRVAKCHYCIIRCLSPFPPFFLSCVVK
ncbi:hypothetical protein BU24DRAFT_174597 [Aaosphaeria arxii CBS 175.79]|uniref:Uncharacterized protein n=1 Tax=Aaosphaeria arxii CBS 175.79 TaxID=1450172 RepID=A0A6A5XQ28_9PLEO|nr:uncharacterized protein BU24DRAFT_174597 [Aaosphaeria arxii CBS 175.79]KAF2015262.1 hypothetical protein BU24DRAFT_174597 [Aaosphaeria arxii CBS 175.79]